MVTYIPNKFIDYLISLIPISFTIFQSINNTYLSWSEITRAFTGCVPVYSSSGILESVAIWDEEESNQKFYSDEIRERDVIIHFFLPYVVEITNKGFNQEAIELIKELFNKISENHFYIDDILLFYIKNVVSNKKEVFYKILPVKFYHFFLLSYSFDENEKINYRILFSD